MWTALVSLAINVTLNLILIPRMGVSGLALASALQRFPAESRADLARLLLQHAADASDHNLPLLLWYGLIPLGDSAPGQLATLGGRAKIPLTARCIARRLAERIEDEPLAEVDLVYVYRQL